MRLKDKVAIITGAGSGIGKETPLIFAKEGASVVCTDLKGAEETAEEIKNDGGKSLAVTMDVSRADDWKKVIEQTLETFEKVNILCNIAGTSEAVDILDITEEEFDRMININLKGVFLGMKAVLPELLKLKGGKTINNASLAAHIGLEGLPSYSASKGGVIAMSRQVAMDYADNPRDY